jgi:CCR4-NOT complex subunit CAF16
MTKSDSGPPLASVESIGHCDLENAIVVKNLEYSFPMSGGKVIESFNLALPRGSRLLLCGANGAGKTTLLQILAGKYMVGGEDTVRVLGRSAFHDIHLTSSGTLSYLGSQWRRNVAVAGGNIPMQGDISAGTMIFGVEGVDPHRRAQLISLLDIDLEWRLNKVSDGQRRRVQIAMGLLKPYQVLLLDEITVDMDVIGRLDLLEFFKRECEERGATVVYATHIFDGMRSWPTHIAYVEDGRMKVGGPVTSLPELQAGGKLLNVVESWLKDEKRRRKQRESQKAPKPGLPSWRQMPRRHMAFFR